MFILSSLNSFFEVRHFLLCYKVVDGGIRDVEDAGTFGQVKSFQVTWVNKKKGRMWRKINEKKRSWKRNWKSQK